MKLGSDSPGGPQIKRSTLAGWGKPRGSSFWDPPHHSALIMLWSKRLSREYSLLCWWPCQQAPTIIACCGPCVACWWLASWGWVHQRVAQHSWLTSSIGKKQFENKIWSPPMHSLCCNESCGIPLLHFLFHSKRPHTLSLLTPECTSSMGSFVFKTGRRSARNRHQARITRKFFLDITHTPSRGGMCSLQSGFKSYFTSRNKSITA